MRRSLKIRIAFMSAFALIAIEGCGDGVLEHCVDENGIVVDDSLCEKTGSLPASPGGHVPYYHWWYGGHTAPGTRISGGSYTPPAIRGGGSIPRSSTIRGGFGSPGGMGHGVGVGA